jgi:hypothetical protein
MGMYELMEGKEVNGRGVWQMAGGVEYFMYYGSNKHWFIGNRARMEEGAGGWMSVVSTALTPDQVTETWQVVDDEGDCVDAPKVRARMYSAEQERQQAMAQAKDAITWQTNVGLVRITPPPSPLPGSRLHYLVAHITIVLTAGP